MLSGGMMLQARHLRLSAVLLAGILLTSLSLLAQQITGDISGVVTDSTGAVLPNITVTAENTDTGLSRSATTSDSGNFRFPQLPIGPYKVTATAQGFKTVIQTAQ